MFDRSYRFRFYRNYLTAENAENAEREKKEMRARSIDSLLFVAPAIANFLSNNYGIRQILIVRSGLPLTKVLLSLLIATELTN